MNNPIPVDVDPLVALLDADDHFHDWAKEEFKHLPAPLSTCEAVLAEAFHLLRKQRAAQEKILDWIERGALKFPLSLAKEANAIHSLWARYENVPMSLADACLVRMAEIDPRARICTIDSDFTIYRKNGHEPLCLVTPRD